MFLPYFFGSSLFIFLYFLFVVLPEESRFVLLSRLPKLSDANVASTSATEKQFSLAGDHVRTLTLCCLLNFFRYESKVIGCYLFSLVCLFRLNFLPSFIYLNSRHSHTFRAIHSQSYSDRLLVFAESIVEDLLKFASSSIASNDGDASGQAQETSLSTAIATNELLRKGMAQLLGV
jgi:hypothetical protein